MIRIISTAAVVSLRTAGLLIKLNMMLLLHERKLIQLFTARRALEVAQVWLLLLSIAEIWI